MLGTCSAVREDVVSHGGSLSFVLGIVFVVLKLTGTVPWRWIWVLAPFWGPVVLWFLFVAVLLVRCLWEDEI